MRSILGISLASAMVLSLASGASATADLPLDEYLCYQAKESKNPTQGKFKDLGVSIRTKDQFDVVRENSVTKYVNFCNPTTPTPSAGNAAIHLAEYAIKDTKVAPKFAAPTSVYNLADRLGDYGITISKPKSVMVRSSKTDFGALIKCKTNADCAASARPTDVCVNGKVCLAPGQPFPPAPGTPVNTADYMCYSTKGTKGPHGTPFAATDQFAYAESYLMNKVNTICAPTEVVELPSATVPDGDGFAGHLVCYQAKSQKTNAVKFVQHEVGITNPLDQRYLDLAKVTQLCIPALKAISPATPSYNTPTTMTTLTADARGVCGGLTTNLAGAEAVPGRLDPDNAGVDPNDKCTGPGAPVACCTGVDAGHCDERTTVTCGSLTFGGGGPSVGNPGGEGGQAGGGQTRYSLACGSPDDTTCAISGNAGALVSGVNCSSTGCGGVTPVESTSPVKVCALNTLAAPGATGNLNLATGEITLATTTNATVHILTTTSFPDTACPRCRTGVATTDAEVFQTAPGSPGVGVCDSDAANAGAACVVFEPAGSTAGLTTDCTPDISGGASAVIAISTTQTTAGASASSATGNFCPAQGQGGNTDCTGAGTPQICCTGAGMGSCNNFNGCFGSANAAGVKFADTPGVCTGISVTGSAPGLLVGGLNGLTTYGTISCIPAVNAGVVLSGLVNNNAGLPGPVVTSSKLQFQLD